MKSLGVVVAVRNEKDSLPKSLASLSNQTVPPELVVVVDDGSTDGTSDFLKAPGSYAFEVQTVTLPFHSGSYVGRPELAQVFNSGLGVIRDSKVQVDYLMILGGDHSLPAGYVDAILSRMESDPNLAVASGWIMGEPFWGHAPRGSSMIARRRFWAQAGGLQFPVNYGWESWLYLKAMQEGYSTRSFRDVPTEVSRKTGLSKGVLYGRGMYALGYDPAYALGRIVLLGTRSPRAAIQMLLGYLDHRGVSRMDVASFVGASQRKAFVGRFFHILTNFGRK